MAFRSHRHNFLHAKPARLPRKRHPAVRAAWIAAVALFGIVAVVALLVLPFWYVSEKVYVRMAHGRGELMAAEQDAQGMRFDSSLQHVDTAEGDFADARLQLQSLLPFEDVPVIGPHITAADRLLVSADAASSAIHDVLGVAQQIAGVVQTTAGVGAQLHGAMPDMAALFKDLTPDQKRQMLETLSRSVPDIRDAEAKIDAAIADLDQIPQDRIAAQFAAPLVPFRQKLVTLRAGLDAVLPIAEIAPGALGYPDEKHYLFFFQNNTELRPTGGFLGVYGLATVKDADLTSLVTDDVYALDGPAESTARPAPPDPIRKYIGIDKWYLRDANWSPDFVISSGIMQKFFAEEAANAYHVAPPRVDGVIAIDPQVAIAVLKLTGPIVVDKTTFTADNVVDQLEFAVEAGFAQQGVPFAQRKGIVGALVSQVVKKLTGMPVAQLLAAAGLVKEELAEGHILLESNDGTLETMILQNDWGGKLKPVTGDYLSVIDANLASLKSDPVVKRTIAYHVSPAKDGGYEAKVDVTYQNTGTFTWKTTRYRTYARVYVPLGSSFEAVSGAMENDKLKDPGRHPGHADVGVEAGHGWFGAFISIEPGETRTLEFRYKLSPHLADVIAQGSYHLDVEKQPGTVAHGLTLDLDFGKKLTTAEPPEDRKYWGDTRYTFDTDLRIDRTFDVGL